VRGIGAFVQDAEPRRLPASIRRFRGWRPQTLNRHRSSLFDALEDEDFRAAILEWLSDGHPPLSTPDATTLKIATERNDGWGEELAGRSSPRRRSPAPSSDESGGRIARERERTKKARADLRRAKEELRTATEDLQRRLARLEKERDALQRLLAERDANSESLRTRLVAAREDVDRERRRWRRQEHRAGTDAAELRAEVKTLRRALSKAESEVEALRRNADRTGPPESEPPPEPPPSPPRRHRQPLAVPKGRFEDDPQTLDEWLDRGAWLLVDGYNVTKAEGGFSNLALEVQRERLVDEVRKLVTKKRVRATIVFDGSEVPPGTKRLERGPIAVEYSSPDEPADDHLIALLESGPPEPAVLVSSDRDLQARAAALGATIAGSRQLLELIR
jgi:predicted RNA-binding protein with PIN domain